MDAYKELKAKNEPDISNTNSSNQNKINFGGINMDTFEDNLNISDIKDELKNNQNIEQTPPIKTNKCLNFLSNKSIDKDFSEDLDDINEEFSERKITISSFQSEEFNCDNNNININSNNNNKQTDFPEEKKILKKLTKEDLNNIPLPLFSCIYCSNETLSFNHISLEILSTKYLFQTSIYDIKDLNSIILWISQPLLEKEPPQNEKLLDIVIKNTEYISKNYNFDYMKNFFGSKNFRDICNRQHLNSKKYFVQRIEESIIKKKKDFYFKGINRISKNSLNNKCLFNSMNSFINNYNGLSGFVETLPVNNMNINIGKSNNMNINNSNISLNFNSISLNNNETGNNCKENNLLVSIVEHIENNNGVTNEIEDKEEIIDIFGFDKFDLERRITKDNILWENNCYNIWNPIISDDDILEDNNSDINYINLKANDYYCSNMDNIEKKRYKLKVNLLKSKTSNNSFNYQINSKLSLSHIKSMGSTNSSSVINNDNENKIKSNKLSHSKDINNYICPKKTIHVNTIQKNDKIKKMKNNNSVIINNSTLKSKNILKYPNLFKKNINKRKIITNKNNTIKNNLSTTSYIFNIKKNYNSNKTNLPKFTKKKISFNEHINNNKIMEKNKKCFINNKNFKGITRKINNFKMNKSYLYNNYINRTIGGARLSNSNNISSNSSIINIGNKKISSSILFKQNNNKTINNNNNFKKSFQINNNSILSKSKISFLYDKTNEKSSIEKIRAKISEINKFINNYKNIIKVYNYPTNNKMNSTIVNNNQSRKERKIIKNIELGSTYFTNNIYKKLNNTNNSINKNIFLPSSINVRPKTKMVEINVKKIL